MKEKNTKKGCLAIKPKNSSHAEATAAAYGVTGAAILGKRKYHARSEGADLWSIRDLRHQSAVQVTRLLELWSRAYADRHNMEFVRSLGAANVLDYTKEESATRLGEYDFILRRGRQKQNLAPKKSMRLGADWKTAAMLP